MCKSNISSLLRFINEFTCAFQNKEMAYESETLNRKFSQIILTQNSIKTRFISKLLQIWNRLWNKSVEPYVLKVYGNFPVLQHCFIVSQSNARRASKIFNAMQSFYTSIQYNIVHSIRSVNTKYLEQAICLLENLASLMYFHFCIQPKLFVHKI